jgi:hypothetical protein
MNPQTRFMGILAGIFLLVRLVVPDFEGPSSWWDRLLTALPALPLLVSWKWAARHWPIWIFLLALLLLLFACLTVAVFSLIGTAQLTDAFGIISPLILVGIVILVFLHLKWAFHCRNAFREGRPAEDR